MIACQKTMLISTLISGIACTSVVVAEPLLEATVYERSSQTLKKCQLLQDRDRLYLPLELLIEDFKLESKPLPKDQLGICLDDRCIPFSGEVGLRHVQAQNDVLYLSIDRLVKGMGGTRIWHAKSRTLLIDLASKPVRKSQSANQVLDAQLTDLDGNPVRLSSLHGKRILLFAWASW